MKMFEIIDGIPNALEQKKIAEEYYSIICHEFKKFLKLEEINNILKSVHIVDLVIDKECDDVNPPQYTIYDQGTNNTDLQRELKSAIENMVKEGCYSFHFFHNQLQNRFSMDIAKFLSNEADKEEYWCRLLSSSRTPLYKPIYSFIVLCFDKKEFENISLYNGKKHPFFDSLKRGWSYSTFIDVENEKSCYNELFRRAAINCDYFVYLYGDVFNVLSALKYENESNVGSLLAISRSKVESFEELDSNYEISIRFKEPIKIDGSYKKIRKLLEITNNEFSLLMNENGDIFALGKMVNEPTCEYYQVIFEGFLKWSLYKNNSKFLTFENMIPMIPGTEIGITKNNIELLKETFKDLDNFNKENCLEIINDAIFQKHGTTIVFTENASDEAERLYASGISIEPKEIIGKERLVKEVSSIDGAILCDAKGVCYSIGVILDGVASENADSSRGARYNSAIRYIEQQKKINVKTFIAVVSEDGYVDCFSTFENFFY